MLAVFSRTAQALVVAAVVSAGTSSAFAQFFDPCNVCAAPVAVAINPCPCVQPITETVYREVPVTKFRTVERAVKKPVVRTAYEDRPITAYRTVNETRTAEVPSMTYQQVTECQQCTVNRSFWRTAYQPVAKMHPCQYDPSPTLVGELNRLGYATRMAMTPNYIPRREFVPNIVAYNVPVTKTVAVPTTRQVTYNVARLEPYETTQRVAVQKVEYVDSTVTAYEPYTEMRTVAVGTATRYAFVDPLGGSTATAARPTPATTAEGPTPVPERRANNTPNTNSSAAPPRTTNENSGSRGTIEFNSFQRPKPQSPAEPTHLDTRNAPEKTGGEVAAAAPAVVHDAGWRPTRSSADVDGPALSVASK